MKKLKKPIKQVILNLIQDLQRLPLLLVNNLRERFQDPVLKHYGAGLKGMPRFGMTPLFNNGGFTLIELLVVVLIIGILAAVAVPQYQKAVDKSRYAAMMPYVNTLAKAQEVYYLANGHYADDWNLLDLDLPNGISGTEGDPVKIGNIELVTNSSYSAAFFKTPNRIFSYVIYTPITSIKLNGVAVAGKTLCLSYGTDNLDRGDRVCKSMNGRLIAEKMSCGQDKCSAYLLE